jgi:hypothetical protein
VRAQQPIPVIGFLGTSSQRVDEAKRTSMLRHGNAGL